MSDIVERLRDGAGTWVKATMMNKDSPVLLREAAAEIQRLRDELASARADEDILRKKALQWREECRAEAEVSKSARAEAFERAAQIAKSHADELWPKSRKPNRSELDVAIFESAASEADAIAAAIRAEATREGSEG